MATKALSFDVGDYVVYPKHGVGRVVELQSTEIAGCRLDLYVLRFEKEKMTLRVPVNKADSVGMRKLSSDKTMKDALDTLTSKPKVKRTMWPRRAWRVSSRRWSRPTKRRRSPRSWTSSRSPGRSITRPAKTHNFRSQQ